MITVPVALVGAAALVVLVMLVLLCGKKKTPQAASALNMNYLEEVPVSASLFPPSFHEAHE